MCRYPSQCDLFCERAFEWQKKEPHLQSDAIWMMLLLSKPSVSPFHHLRRFVLRMSTLGRSEMSQCDWVATAMTFGVGCRHRSSTSTRHILNVCASNRYVCRVHYGDCHRTRLDHTEFCGIEDVSGKVWDCKTNHQCSKCAHNIGVFDQTLSVKPRTIVGVEQRVVGWKSYKVYFGKSQSSVA